MTPSLPHQQEQKQKQPKYPSIPKEEEWAYIKLMMLDSSIRHNSRALIDDLLDLETMALLKETRQTSETIRKYIQSRPHIEKLLLEREQKLAHPLPSYHELVKRRRAVEAHTEKSLSERLTALETAMETNPTAKVTLDPQTVEVFKRASNQSERIRRQIESGPYLEKLLGHETVNKDDNNTEMMLETLQQAVLYESKAEPYKLVQMNKGLIHVLQVIRDAPNGRMSTRGFLKEIGSWEMQKDLKKAVDLNLVRREKERMPKGQKGRERIINYLTEEGKRLLEFVENKEHFINSTTATIAD